MPRKTQSQRLNAALALMGEIVDLIGHTLNIYFPGSEAAQKKAAELRMMAAGLIDVRAGFPVGDDIESPQTMQEVPP